MAIRYAKWNESPEEIQEQIRIAEEVIRPLGFPPKKKSVRKKPTFTLTVEKVEPDLSVLISTKRQPLTPKKKLVKI